MSTVFQRIYFVKKLIRREIMQGFDGKFCICKQMFQRLKTEISHAARVFINKDIVSFVSVITQ